MIVLARKVRFHLEIAGQNRLECQKGNFRRVLALLRNVKGYRAGAREKCPEQFAHFFARAWRGVVESGSSCRLAVEHGS